MRLDLDELEGWLKVISEIPWHASRPRKRVQIKDAHSLFVNDGYGFRRVEDAMAVAPCMNAMPDLVHIARAVKAHFDLFATDPGHDHANCTVCGGMVGRAAGLLPGAGEGESDGDG